MPVEYVFSVLIGAASQLIMWDLLIHLEVVGSSVQEIENKTSTLYYPAIVSEMRKTWFCSRLFIKIHRIKHSNLLSYSVDLFLFICAY